MSTLRDAARRAGKVRETIGHWIRARWVPARTVGPRHVIEERDLQRLLHDEVLPVPDEWARMPDGRPVPNVVRAIRLSRRGH